MLVSERGFKLIVFKKVEPIVWLKFGIVQNFDILNFLRGATKRDSFLKALKISNTEKFFRRKSSYNPDEVNNQELLPYAAFQNKLRKYNPLEKKYLDYEKMICSGLTTEIAVFKMAISEIPPKGAENYSHL